MVDARGQVVGYVRVSTADQNLARQVAAVGEVDRLFEEKRSAATAAHRPVLQDMLRYVREGDTIRVKSPDRLGRSTMDVLGLVQDLAQRGVNVEFVDAPALNTGTAQGEFMLTILAAVSQLERSMIKERQSEGIALAKERGVYDRLPKLDGQQVAEVRRLTKEGVPVAELARRYGVSRTTMYAVINGTGRYADDGEHEQRDKHE